MQPATLSIPLGGKRLVSGEITKMEKIMMMTKLMIKIMMMMLMMMIMMMIMMMMIIMKTQTYEICKR